MSFILSHCRTVCCFSNWSYDEKQTINQDWSHEFCGSRHCFSYCFWPPVQQKGSLLIGLNYILFCSITEARSPRRHISFTVDRQSCSCHNNSLLFYASLGEIVQERNPFWRSVAPPCEKVIFAFERSYITSAMRKLMLDVPVPGSFWNIGH